MVAAEKYCSQNNLKLTPLRRKVFEFLIKDHKALGAYKILDMLRDSGYSSNPPIAYRVLDFLVEHGFVHKIEGLNAFIACTNPGISHVPAFMICRKCDKVAEIEDTTSKFKMANPSHSMGFKIEEAIIEMTGVCNYCLKMHRK